MRRTLLVITSVALVALGVTPVAAQSLKIECGASHAAADDPIVFPGQPGAAHLHEFFGNTSTNASSTYASMLEADHLSLRGRYRRVLDACPLQLLGSADRREG